MEPAAAPARKRRADEVDGDGDDSDDGFETDTRRPQPKARRRRPQPEARRRRPSAASCLHGGAPLTTRKPWSHHDMLVLIGLINERRASWADMQRYDSHRFETPRNQQAYRDKARNLKVELLLNDAALPPGFDFVALGGKEMERVRVAGKNPHRTETDVDARGLPVATLLEPLE